jgi:hypothetical protein
VGREGLCRWKWFASSASPMGSVRSARIHAQPLLDRRLDFAQLTLRKLIKSM